VQIACQGAVGRCVGRLVLRDRRGRLAAKAVSLGVGRARWARVSLARRPGRRISARVLTLQPGGYVIASLSYALRGEHRG
jgi:hypothetical protein